MGSALHFQALESDLDRWLSVEFIFLIPTKNEVKLSYMNYPDPTSHKKTSLQTMVFTVNGGYHPNPLNLYRHYVRAITQLQSPFLFFILALLKSHSVLKSPQRKWSISESEHFCWCPQPWLTKDKTRPLLSCPFARPHGGFASSMGSAGTTREQRNSSSCQEGMAEDSKPTAYFSRQTKQLIWNPGNMKVQFFCLFFLPSVSKLKPHIIFTQINLKQKALADSMFPAE